MPIFSPIHVVYFKSLNGISVKRDDLIDPYISGNKWRKLKYILQDVLQNNKNHLVTFGGAYSNHLVATAAAAARNNLRSTAFVRGENVENEMLLLCKLFGMQLIFVDRESYKNKAELFSSHFGDDEKAYFINEGGASPEATIGCAEIIDELTVTYDHIFCAAGTGTTADQRLPRSRTVDAQAGERHTTQPAAGRQHRVAGTAAHAQQQRITAAGPANRWHIA